MFYQFLSICICWKNPSWPTSLSWQATNSALSLGVTHIASTTFKTSSMKPFGSSSTLVPWKSGRVYPHEISNSKNMSTSIRLGSSSFTSLGNKVLIDDMRFSHHELGQIQLGSPQHKISHIFLMKKILRVWGTWGTCGSWGYGGTWGSWWEPPHSLPIDQQYEVGQHGKGSSHYLHLSPF